MVKRLRPVTFFKGRGVDVDLDLRPGGSDPQTDEPRTADGDTAPVATSATGDHDGPAVDDQTGGPKSRETEPQAKTAKTGTGKAAKPAKA